MTREEVHAMIMAFPAVEEGTSYGQPSYKVRGKFLTRLRTEDDSLVLMDIGFDEREVLMEAEPATFHITPHYKDYPIALARIATIHRGALASLLERRWRKIASKASIKAYDAEKNRPA